MLLGGRPSAHQCLLPASHLLRMRVRNQTLCSSLLSNYDGCVCEGACVRPTVGGHGHSSVGGHSRTRHLPHHGLADRSYPPVCTLSLSTAVDLDIGYKFS